MNQKSPEAFRTISEVADWLGVPTHVLRFWESRFAQVKPVKRAGGRRYYRPSDMMLLGGIRKLLHEDGMTIRGVQKLLREHGVKHVAAMSPPMDLGASVGVATKDNVVDLSDRRDAREPVEDAEIIEERAAPEESERHFPFDDEPVPAAPQGVGESEVSEPAAPDAQSAEEATADTPAQAAKPEGETPLEERAEAGAEESSEATTQETEPSPAAVATGLDITDPLPEPEAMDFMAHAAPPDTTEAAPEGPAAPAAKAPLPETSPEDPMSSPEALDFAAHGGEPELAEDDGGVADSADIAAEPEAEEPADAAAAETAPADVESHPEERPEPKPEPAPALVMPEIDDDPDDDDREAGPLYAADLRHLRATRGEVDLAALQALGDRLDEIQRRLAGRDGAAGGL